MNRKNYLFLIPAIVGLCLVGVGLFGDLFGVGSRGGFGTKQRIFVLCGALLVILPLVLNTPFGRRVQTRISPTIKNFFGESFEPFRHLYLIIWFGLFSGLLEGLVYAIQQNVFHKILSLSRDVYWMVSLSNIMIFAIAGAFLFLLGCMSPLFAPLNLTIFTLTFMQVTGLLFLLAGRISESAVLLLALGVAFQTTRWISTRIGKFITFTQKSYGWLLVLNVAVFLIGGGFR